MKKFAILPDDLSQEGGELTPTLKVKRAVVASKYADEIDTLYADLRLRRAQGSRSAAGRSDRG